MNGVKRNEEVISIISSDCPPIKSLSFFSFHNDALVFDDYIIAYIELTLKYPSCI